MFLICFYLQVIFEGLVGDGFLGDIAIDDVWFLAASCEVEPKRASRSVKGIKQSQTFQNVFSKKKINSIKL